MAEFLVHALAAGLMVALVAGPLGALVVWQRLAYFGETLAHSALMGAAIGLWLHLNPWWTVLAVSLILATLLVLLQGRLRVGGDSLLGIFSHGSLAFGLLALGLVRNARVDPGALLFGDLLAVGPQDLFMIAAVTGAIALVLWRLWDRLLALTVHAELAAVEGLPVARLRIVQMLLMAALVAVAMRVIGVLLVTAMLIIPAVAARPLARTPEQMALLAGVVGAVAVCGGVFLAVLADLPVGPAIVASAVGLFCLSLCLPQR